MAAPEINAPSPREAAYRGLGGAVNALKAGISLAATIDAFKMMLPPSRNRGSAFLDGEEKSFDVDIEDRVEVMFIDLTEGHEGTEPGIGEHNVQLALFLFHHRV